MSLTKAKLAIGCGLAAVGLAACGTTAKPLAGTADIAHAPGIHGKVDDPRTNVNNHVKCLRQHKIPVVEVGTTGLQIGSPPSGPSVQFTPTPGAAQYDQISGAPQYEGAEVIGSALLYPNQGTASELQTVENCLAEGVAG